MGHGSPSELAFNFILLSFLYITCPSKGVSIVKSFFQAIHTKRGEIDFGL